MTLDFGSLPKVLLHDHLDGGLRATTLVELAKVAGYRRLPTANPQHLADWITRGSAGSIEKILWAVKQVIAVTQTTSALQRVGKEAAEDLARDGVVYAETRFAPLRHTAGDLSAKQAIDAVLAGLNAGASEADIHVCVVLAAMRNEPDVESVVRLAIDYRDRGVVGFDIAGPEVGFSNLDHTGALRVAHEADIPVTLHAGDESGPDSIAEAIELCGARRVGVAHRLIDDIEMTDDGEAQLGPTARLVRDRAIPLEICPRAGIHLHGLAAGDHPVGVFHASGLPITINTDSRLIADTSMTREMELLHEHYGFTIDDLRSVTLRAVDVAFCDDETRASVRRIVERGFTDVEGTASR